MNGNGGKDFGISCDSFSPNTISIYVKHKGNNTVAKYFETPNPLDEVFYFKCQQSAMYLKSVAYAAMSLAAVTYLA